MKVFSFAILAAAAAAGASASAASSLRGSDEKRDLKVNEIQVDPPTVPEGIELDLNFDAGGTSELGGGNGGLEVGSRFGSGGGGGGGECTRCGDIGRCCGNCDSSCFLYECTYTCT